MNIVNDIRSVTQLKSRAAELLNEINENRRPIIITQNGEPRAVLQDPESYQAMQNVIGLLRLINQSEAELREGKTVAQEDVFAKLENMLRDM